MKAVIQRVSRAGITIDGKQGGEMGRGFVILLGVMKGDTLLEVNTLAEKLAGLRVFTDEQDKMNLSLNDVGGDILLVSNFTLGADCRKAAARRLTKACRPLRRSLCMQGLWKRCACSAAERSIPENSGQIWKCHWSMTAL